MLYPLWLAKARLWSASPGWTEEAGLLYQVADHLTTTGQDAAGSRGPRRGPQRSWQAHGFVGGSARFEPKLVASKLFVLCGCFCLLVGCLMLFCCPVPESKFSCSCLCLVFLFCCCFGIVLGLRVFGLLLSWLCMLFLLCFCPSLLLRCWFCAWCFFPACFFPAVPCHLSRAFGAVLSVLASCCVCFACLCAKAQ